MVMAREHASDSVLRLCPYVRRRVVCVERELPLHVIEEQPVVQALALEQFGIRAAQPCRDRSESGLVEPSLARYRWVLTRLGAPSQDRVEFDIGRLGQRLGEVDKARDASLV